MGKRAKQSIVINGEKCYSVQLLMPKLQEHAALSTIELWLHTGRIVGHKVNNVWYMPQASVDYLKQYKRKYYTRGKEVEHVEIKAQPADADLFTSLQEVIDETHEESALIPDTAERLRLLLQKQQEVTVMLQQIINDL